MTDIRAVLSRRRTRSSAGAVITGALVVLCIQQTWSGSPVTFSHILQWVIAGVALGSIYGVAAQGLVVTYATSGVFNFAQGAIGMFMAYVYWEFDVDFHMPTVLAVFLTVFVCAPLAGVFVERMLMRFLVDSPIVAQLVVTIGLMLALVGLAASVWNPNTSRIIPRFFGTSGTSLGDTYVPYYRVVTILTGVAVGIALRFLLYHTRLGVTMRAVVDNRDLTTLSGARPAAATMTAWALGSSMAALAGIFLAEELASLDPTTLTLFIVDAFAAGVIARLKSLPMAYVGGLIIGLTLSFQQNFLIWTGKWTQAPQAIPAIILFIAVIFIPDSRIQGRLKARVTAERLPTIRNAIIGFVFLIVATFVCAAAFDRANVREVILVMLTAFVMLSLVPLTGWANQISLAQITLVGVGAFAFVEWGHNGNVLDLLIAAAVAIPAGLLMAGPAIRLQGIYLALATMAFARMAEFLFFDQPKVFGNGDRQVPQMSVFGLKVNQPFSFWGIDFAQDAGYLIFVTIMFCIVGMIIVLIRRNSFGRRLVAMRDSPSACSMLGMSLVWTKLSVFVLSASIAGLAGGLFAVYYGSVGTASFQLTAGLPYLLLLVVGGLSTVGGCVFGGLAFVQFAWLNNAFPNNTFLDWFQKLGPGLLGIGVGRSPEGAWEQNVSMVNKLVKKVRGGKTKEIVAADAPRFEDLPNATKRKNPDRPAVELRDVSVRFGGLQAVKSVSIELEEGKITGLIGPNGAGKTTLFNVATGLQEPNQGRIFVDGVDATGARAHQFARKGLARTFQRLEVFGSLSVRDNIRVAAETHRRRWAQGSVKPDVVADSIIARMGLQAVAHTRTDALPTGTARLVEVGRALATQPRVLLLDEPSSGLSTAETDKFAELLRELAASGLALLVVEHDMGFIMQLCNDIIVLDAGEVIAEGTPAEVQVNPRVLEAYLGTGGHGEPAQAPVSVVQEAAAHGVSVTDVAPANGAVPTNGAVPAGTGAGANGSAATKVVTGPTAIELRGVSAGYGGIDVLHEVNLSVRKGEVCAILGPNGAGKSTTLKVVSGQIKASHGTVLINDSSIAKVSTDHLVRNGLCVVPEGRGIFPNLTVSDNLKMASYAGASFAEILEYSFERFPRLESRRNQLAGTLSGGEQQMLAMSRALSVKPQILLVDELSMGLAPKIVEDLYEVIAQIAAEGLTILVVEQFAAEVLKVADSAALLINGRITFQGAPSVVNEMISSAYLGGEVASEMINDEEPVTLTEA